MSVDLLPKRVCAYVQTRFSQRDNDGQGKLEVTSRLKCNFKFQESQESTLDDIFRLLDDCLNVTLIVNIKNTLNYSQKRCKLTNILWFFCEPGTTAW